MRGSRSQTDVSTKSPPQDIRLVVAASQPLRPGVHEFVKISLLFKIFWYFLNERLPLPSKKN